MTISRRTIIALVFASGAACSPHGTAAQTQEGFKTPSNNIFCIIEPPYDNHPDSDLRCDLQQMRSRPSRPKDCTEEWGDAFSIGQRASRGVRICHGDTTRNEELMELSYGSEWKQGGFSCKSETSGLTCANTNGHGFTLSRSAQKVF
jgi:hypothetical protein